MTRGMIHNAAMGHSRTIEVKGPAGRIEAILQGSDDDRPSRVAVVCHPHPLYGGTMHTKVVHRAAKALEESGHRVVRFNFRGVGLSEGVHDHGPGERDDASVVLDHVRALHPGLPATMAGFSFGSWVALSVGCADPGVDALIGIAPPVNLADFGFLAACPKPKLFIHGTADTIAPFDQFERFFGSIVEPKILDRIDGASHLLTEHLDQVEAAIRTFIAGLRRSGGNAPTA
jgi:alpha/beta superfamily hydrolase